MSSERKKEKGIYNWAYMLGAKILCRAQDKFNPEVAENMLLRILRELRNEMMADRFRWKLSKLISDTLSSLDVVASFIPQLKEEKKWTLDDFYRISSLILMGLWDSYSTFKQNVKKLCESG